MNNTVIIYGAQWCQPCKAAQERLRRAGVQFRYVDVEKEPYPNWVQNLPAFEVNGKAMFNVESVLKEVKK